MVLWLAYFWTTSALFGLILTSRSFLAAWKGWKLLRAQAHDDDGLVIMAFNHVRQDGIRLWMHFTFLVIGMMASIPHGLFSPEYWISTFVLMTVPLLLIVMSLTASHDSNRVVRNYQKKLP